jgi:hypothetical protein
MPEASGSVPNLINGVSQQAPAMRLPSQAELSDNYYPTVVDGNTKRPRTNHEAIIANLPEDAFTHFILRDQDEKYLVAVYTDGTLKVWDFAGDEKTVVNSGAAYLAGLTNAKDELRALTVADHTFITNKKRVVAAGATTSPARPYEALMHVLQGNYGKSLIVIIDGVERAAITIPDGTSPWNTTWTDTNVLANYLWHMLASGSAPGLSGSVASGYWTHSGGDGLFLKAKADNNYDTTPWGLGLYHSTLYLRNADDDFTLNVQDGYAGRGFKDVKNVVQKFADLPLYGPDGYVVQVVGDASNSFDNYWVEFQKDADVNTMGVWRECIAPATTLGLNAATMPHQLRREADGTFTFGPATWDARKCGNLEKNPDPSFVGQTIEDLLFHKNRFGFLTRENLVLSESGKFFNFYRTTMTALLDTDPIDISASHIKVSLLRHAVPYQKELVLWSDETQFVLTGKELLTPKSVTADPITELESHPIIRPIGVGGTIYYVVEKGDWASLVEYYLDKALETADYDDVTSHAPSYIPSGLRHIIANPTINFVGITTDGDPGAMYCYSFHWNGQEKLQSAWCRWTFPGVDQIVNATFDRGLIRMLVRRGSMVYLETINAERKAKDAGVHFVTYLDRMLTLDDGVYDLETGTTTFTLPFDAPEGLVAVTAPGDLPAGVELVPMSIVGPTVVFDRDLTDQPVHFGVPYESRHRLSTLFVRDRQSQQAATDGRTQVLHLSIAFAGTGYFRVEVTAAGRPTRTYHYTGRTVGDPANMTGTVVLKDGHISVPIMSRNDRVMIDLVNDTWLPCAFTGAKWTGTWNPHSKEL